MQRPVVAYTGYIQLDSTAIDQCSVIQQNIMLLLKRQDRRPKQQYGTSELTVCENIDHTEGECAIMTTYKLYPCG